MSRRGRTFRLLACSGLLVTAVPAAGCGTLGASYTGLRLVHPKPVSVELEPLGTPARTVLDWFAAMQRSDSVAAARLYAPRARVTPDVMRFARAGGRSFFARAQPPRVLDVSMTKQQATVYAAFDVRWASPDKRTVVSTQPQAFELVRDGGSWKLADDLPLQSLSTLTPAAPCPTC